jgi:hypothetical protein
VNGTSTGITLPAYTLPGGTQLTGHLAIARPGLPNTNSVPGAIGIAGLARETAFPLVTRPPPLPPRLEVVSADANPLILRFLGEPNRVYQLQAGPDFQTWTNLLTTNLSTGEGRFVDDASPRLPQCFYRLQVGSTNLAGR